MSQERRICWNCLILESIAAAITVYFVVWYVLTVHPRW